MGLVNFVISLITLAVALACLVFLILIYQHTSSTSKVNADLSGFFKSLDTNVIKNEVEKNI
jgi:hypothetical protein